MHLPCCARPSLASPSAITLLLGVTSSIPESTGGGTETKKNIWTNSHAPATVVDIFQVVPHKWCHEGTTVVDIYQLVSHTWFQEGNIVVDIYQLGTNTWFHKGTTVVDTCQLVFHTWCHEVTTILRLTYTS